MRKASVIARKMPCIGIFSLLLIASLSCLVATLTAIVQHTCMCTHGVTVTEWKRNAWTSLKMHDNTKGPSLTARTAWAATFEHLFTRTTPRTDCPLELPDIAPPAAGELDRQLALPIDEHARGVIKMLCDMTGGKDVRVPTDPAAEQSYQQQQRRDARGNLTKHTAPYSNSAAAADQHCADLGICLPRGDSAAAGCGAGISSNEQFSDFRAKMWRKWMQM